MTAEVRKSPKAKKDELSEGEKLFVSSFCVCFNRKQAAKEAGYKGTNLAKRGDEIYHRPRVKAAIAEHVKELIQKNDAEVGMLITKAKQLMDFDPGMLLDANGDVLPVNKLPDSVRLAIIGCEITEKFNVQTGTKIRTYVYKFESRQASLDKLFRYHALYEDTLKLTTKHDIRVVYEKPPVTEQPQTIMSTRN